MIYVILDRSFDYAACSSEQIVYISTDKENAVKFFEEHFAELPESEKWTYEYSLVEYEDGFAFDNEKASNVLLESRNY